MAEGDKVFEGEPEGSFQSLAFQVGFAAPYSGRFWVFADSASPDDIEPKSAFVSFGSTGGLGRQDGTAEFHHVVQAVARMDRKGWIELVRVLKTQLRLTEEELARGSEQLDEAEPVNG